MSPQKKKKISAASPSTNPQEASGVRRASGDGLPCCLMEKQVIQGCTCSAHSQSEGTGDCWSRLRHRRAAPTHRRRAIGRNRTITRLKCSSRRARWKPRVTQHNTHIPSSFQSLFELNIYAMYDPNRTKVFVLMIRNHKTPLGLLGI